MRNVSVAEIRQMDQSATRDYAIPSLLLMENAGRSVSDVISRDYPCLSFHSIKGDKDCPNFSSAEIDRNWDYKPCKVLIFAGMGNNGGDGLVVARHLCNRGYSVQVGFLEDPAGLKADPLLNFSILKKMNIPWVLLADATEEKFFNLCLEADLVVDAILGVGIQRPVCGVFEAAIRAINRSLRPVVSIDIPSGLDADTGLVCGVAVKATKTVTLVLPKRGLFEGEGPGCAGHVEVVDIGIPRELLAPFQD